MNFSFEALSAGERYKLLSGLVTPRPIALVTTRNAEGGDNAAPYSFFNAFSEEPPLVVLGLQARGGGMLKDTTENIRRTGEFVVNLVDEAIAEAMNVCSVDFPPGISEIEAAGLSTVACEAVGPGRIAEAPVSFECRRVVTLELGPMRSLVIGEVVWLHVRDGLVDPESLRVNAERYAPVGRLFGNLYTRTRDHFELVRPSYPEWLAQQEAEA